MADPILQVRNLHKSYGAVMATRDLSLDVRPGEVHALIGPNGAGKTTLMRQLSGQVAPDRGEILFHGRDITRLPVHRRAHLGLGRSFQITQVFDHLTVEDNLALAVQARMGHSFRFWRDVRRDARILVPTRAALARCGLEERARESAGSLSHGEKRQLDMGMALAGDPSLLLMDEPMAGMGPGGAVKMTELIRSLKGKVSLLLVEHDMDAVFSLADRITVLLRGGPGHGLAGRDPLRPLRPGGLPRRGGMPVLTLRDVTAFYGNSQALYGIDFSMQAGEVVTLLGRNGMGKTTVVRAIMGLVPVAGGSIVFEGRDIRNLPSHEIARRGFGLVPEGRQVFGNLTVRENLLVTAANHARSDAPYTLDHVLALFPKLADRLGNYGNQLSGGEQQMLAIGRALMTNPKVLILDEATEGLAPLVRREIWWALRTLKERGESILVIDKNLGALLGIADRHHVLQKGTVVWRGSSSELAADASVQGRYLGV